MCECVAWRDWQIHHQILLLHICIYVCWDVSSDKLSIFQAASFSMMWLAWQLMRTFLVILSLPIGFYVSSNGSFFKVKRFLMPLKSTIALNLLKLLWSLVNTAVFLFEEEAFGSHLRCERICISKNTSPRQLPFHICMKIHRWRRKAIKKASFSEFDKNA